MAAAASGHGGGASSRRLSDDRVNAAALRDMTDDSGGRTEIVRDPQRSRAGDRKHRRRTEQAVLPGYHVSPGRKDGQWHSIRVEVKNRDYRVRSRRGYIAN